MRLLIHKSPEQIAVWTARYIASKINEAAKSGAKPYVLGLPTGSTPLGTYRELIKLHNEGKVSFANVITFNMDEYVGLAEDHPQSYHTFMWENFFSKVDIRKENVNILNGNAPDLELECREYEEKILKAGGIDLFMGGIGSDGHIAFNEPFSSLSSRTRIKSLTRETILANSRFFDNDPNKVPKHSLTVGVATVMSAREVVILATGYNKARALHHVIEEGYNHAWTASAIQVHPSAIMLCDEEACYELKVGTYNYFKDIEEGNLDPMKIKL